MKVYPLNTFREISQMCKESNYNDLQKEKRFRNSQTDESVIDDLISDHPEKSNKVSIQIFVIFLIEKIRMRLDLEYKCLNLKNIQGLKISFFFVKKVFSPFYIAIKELFCQNSRYIYKFTTFI